LLPTKYIFGAVAVSMGHFLWCSKIKALFERLFAFVLSAAWNGQPKCRLCLPCKNFCGRPCLCYLCLQSNICFVLRCI